MESKKAKLIKAESKRLLPAAGGWGNWEILFKDANLQLVVKINPGKLMHSIVIIVNNTVL